MEIAPASLSAFLTVVNSAQNRLIKACARWRAGVTDEQAVAEQMRSFISSIASISRQVGMESLFAYEPVGRDGDVGYLYYKISNDIYRILCHISIDVVCSRTLDPVQRDNLLDGAIGAISKDFELVFADKFNIASKGDILCDRASAPGRSGSA